MIDVVMGEAIGLVGGMLGAHCRQNVRPGPAVWPALTTVAVQPSRHHALGLEMARPRTKGTAKPSPGMREVRGTRLRWVAE